MEKKPRKSARIELTPEPTKPLGERAGDEADAVELKDELKLDELEERVTPRQIGTFF